MGSSGYIVRWRVESSSVEIIRGFAAVIDRRAANTATELNSKGVKGKAKQQTCQPCSA